MTDRIYKVCIDAVDGESFYIAGGTDRGPLLAFLQRYDHEGSHVRLEWMQERDGSMFDSTDDAERVYRILEGVEAL